MDQITQLAIIALKDLLNVNQYLFDIGKTLN